MDAARYKRTPLQLGPGRIGRRYNCMPLHCYNLTLLQLDAVITGRRYSWALL